MKPLTYLRLLLCAAVVLALAPHAAFAQQQLAYAAPGDLAVTPFTYASYDYELEGEQATEPDVLVVGEWSGEIQGAMDDIEAAKVDKILPYDPAAIEQIGNQISTGHSICCPSFSCAYADAVLDGTVHDHSYYCCYSCRWTDWGGGNSAFKCVGTDEQLLREAYDQIAADRPTVIHVVGPYGQHWIALIGYVNAWDPDHLTLDNFVALDPANGAQIIASEKYVLYGDGCEHISER